MLNSQSGFNQAFGQNEESQDFRAPSEFLQNYLTSSVPVKHNKLTPVQAAAQNFGDLPVIGPMIQVIKDYEDRINYRNATPEQRRMLGLE